MLRSRAIRPIVSAISVYPRARGQLNLGSSCSLTQSIIRTSRPILPQPSPNPPTFQKAWFRTSSTGLLATKKQTGKDFEQERARHREQKLKPDPEGVSSTSTVRAVFEPRARVENSSDPDPDMLRGIRNDLRTVRETFALKEVPREVFWIGMGGLTPYVITSISTLYLAWDLNFAAYNGVGYLVSKETAASLLHILEPTQIGLGAIILSFLGAVHWGLEMAQYGGTYPYHRYTIGILAPALAWPTILLPLDFALLVQFAGFVGMYFADSQATTWGWAPRWYTTYRFILTFIVGACIIATLVGRGQIGDTVTATDGARKHLQHIRRVQREHQQKEQGIPHDNLQDSTKAGTTPGANTQEPASE